MLIDTALETEFAPPERLSKEAVMEQHEDILNDKRLSLLYDFAPDFVLVLNEYRQVIFVNKTMINFLKKESAEQLIGMRPGELLGCSGANKETGGCGTSILCSACGAVKAILAANYNNTEVEECCIQTKDSKIMYNFRVWAARPWDDKEYTLLIIRDIADEKFRNALEQTFFHDLTNTASDMKGLLDLINSPEAYQKYLPLLSSISRELLDEINGQRDLRYAEEGIIMIQKSPVKVLPLINALINIYSSQKISKGIKITAVADSEDVTFSSDERLLRRVIENMLKNAVEASKEGQTVSVRCFKDGNHVVFSVHNPNFIEKDIQLNIFKRSFSTKSEGRGWGAYSMKLLTESYLKGEIWFESTPKDGTTFYAKYPLS